MAGVLNSLGRFAAAAATPILLNLVLIGAMVGLSPLLPSPAHALAWGVFGAGILQLLWMLVFCWRAGTPLRLHRPRVTPRVSRLIRRIIPVAIGAGIQGGVLQGDVKESGHRYGDRLIAAFRFDFFFVFCRSGDPTPARYYRRGCGDGSVAVTGASTACR